MIAVLLLVLQSVGCSSDTETRAIDDRTSQTTAKKTTQNTAQSKEAPAKATQQATTKEEMKLAIAAAAKNQFETAIEHLKSLLIVEPENAKAIFLLARCHAGKGNLAEAVDVLQSIPSSEPEFGIPAMGQRAEYLSNLGRLDESVPLWETLLRKLPDLPQVRSSLSTDLYRQGRRIESAKQLQQLAAQGLASEDELRRLLNVTDPPPSRKELAIRKKQKTQNAKEPGSDSNATLNQVWAAIKENLYRKALGIADRVAEQQLTGTGTGTIGTQKRNDNTATLQNDVLRAWLAAELMDFDTSLSILQALPETASQFPSYWLAVGAIHESNQNLNGAISAYHRAMNFDPTREATHDRLSAALLKRGDQSAAQRVDERRFTLAGPAEAVLAIGPGQPDDLAACQAMLEDLESLGRFDQAAAWLIRVAPRHARAFGGQQQVEKRIANLRAKTIKERQELWSGGIDAQSLPDPTLEIHREPTNTNADVDLKDFPDDDGDIQFSESSLSLGLNFGYSNATPAKSRLLRLFEQLGGGVAALDFDRDGDADLFFSQAGGNPPNEKSNVSNALFQNHGGKFVDVSSLSGIEDTQYSLGATFCDWNQDGQWDLLVANFGKNQLLVNQGDGTFRDRSDWIVDSNEPQMSMTASVAVADLDGDMLPDLVEANYVDDEAVYQPVPVAADGYPAVYVGPNKFRSGIDRVGFAGPDGIVQLRALANGAENTSNEQNTPEQPSGASADPTKVPKLGDDAQPGLGIMIANLDGTKGLECFVANDARPNQCWQVKRNESGARTFSESATAMGLATSGQGKSTACMGIATADFDRNGLPDLVVTNWYEEWLNLYQQLQPGRFTDRAPRFGLDQYSDRHVGFGVLAEDFDNDRWTDLVIGNGHVDDFSNQGIPQKMPTQVLRHLGNRFDELEQKDAYFSAGHLSRCLVAADLNLDGLQDVVVTDLIDRASILLNTTPNEHHWLQLELVATIGERSAVGSAVSIAGVKPKLQQQVLASSGYMGRSENVIHFGLGDLSNAVDVDVEWADGSKELFQDVPVNRRTVLVQGQSDLSKD